MGSSNNTDSDFFTVLESKKRLCTPENAINHNYMLADTSNYYGDIEHNFKGLHLRKYHLSQNSMNSSQSDAIVNYPTRTGRYISESIEDLQSTFEPPRFTDFSMENILKKKHRSFSLHREGATVSMSSLNRLSSFHYSPNKVHPFKKISQSTSEYNSCTNAPFYHRQIPRSRTFYDPDKLSLLENAFNENPYAQKSTRIYISNALNITENQVKVWFQNRRSKRKNLKNNLTKQKNTDHENENNNTSLEE